jgi:hypothetical protein
MQHSSTCDEEALGEAMGKGFIFDGSRDKLVEAVIGQKGEK